MSSNSPVSHDLSAFLSNTTATQTNCILKGLGLGTCYSAAYKTRTAALYNLGSGSWLAWADDTVPHYATIHCSRWWTIGPVVQHTDIPPRDGNLSWPMTHVTHHTVDPWPIWPMTHDPWSLPLRMGQGGGVAWWYWPTLSVFRAKNCRSKLSPQLW